MRLIRKILFFILSMTITAVGDVKSSGVVDIFQNESSHLVFQKSQPIVVIFENHFAKNICRNGENGLTCGEQGMGRAAIVAKGGTTIARTPTRFVTNAKGVTTDLQPTLNRIATGGKFPHVRDGSVFRNAEGLLPQQNLGHYLEFVHPTPGIPGPGPMRIVTGQGGYMWFTPDHYRTFIPIAW